MGKCKSLHLGWGGELAHWTDWKLSGSLGEKCLDLALDAGSLCAWCQAHTGCSVIPVE